ncbi:MAG TPA: hypothetical protein VKS60_15750 [Stellaceae bacterium]|nr:hypothetical protein [Stellaceae bacterium]
MNRFAISAAAAAITLAASGVTAHASCFSTEQAASPVTPKLLLPTPRVATADPKRTYSPHEIVGFWHTTYTVGGSVFNESFQQWHSDGTEFEFADIPPNGGDICMGAWSRGPGGVVNVYHTAWTFDSTTGAVNGTMVLTGSYTVSKHGTAFSGPFEIKLLDTDGNTLVDLSGTASSERIPAP